VQILQQLKAAGVITSVRGASGGYRLTKPPGETSLGEVIGLIEGPNSHGLIGGTDATPVGRVLLNKWQELAHAETQILESTTLADLVEQVQDEAARCTTSSDRADVRPDPVRHRPATVTTQSRCESAGLCPHGGSGAPQLVWQLRNPELSRQSSAVAEFFPPCRVFATAV
jgi:hypothetical protein